MMREYQVVETVITRRVCRLVASSEEEALHKASAYGRYQGIAPGAGLVDAHYADVHVLPATPRTAEMRIWRAQDSLTREWLAQLRAARQESAMRGQRPSSTSRAGHGARRAVSALAALMMVFSVLTGPARAEPGYETEPVGAPLRAVPELSLSRNLWLAGVNGAGIVLLFFSGVGGGLQHREQGEQLRYVAERGQSFPYEAFNAWRDTRWQQYVLASIGSATLTGGVLATELSYRREDVAPWIPGILGTLGLGMATIGAVLIGLGDACNGEPRQQVRCSER